MATAAATTPPITVLSSPQEQHMLLLFLPIKAGKGGVAAEAGAQFASSAPDTRAATGVHFAMFYGLKAGAPSTLPVPTFQTAPGKDLVVGLSIYDGDFFPYISAFTSQPTIAAGLDFLIGNLDETGIVPPTDKTSAAYILEHGGVAQQTPAFITLLMRYNFGDPTLPAVTSLANMVNPPTHPKYLLNATFPGLTVGSTLNNYPAAQSLWPWPPVKINYQ